MGSSMFGYDSAFIGGTMSLLSFQTRFGLADADPSVLASLRANIVSTFQAGCFFGVLFCYPTVERLGMKWTLVICGAIFNLGAIIQTASTGQLGMIYGGRVLTGKSDDVASWILLTYQDLGLAPPHSSFRCISPRALLLRFAVDLSAFSRSCCSVLRFRASGSTMESSRTSRAAAIHNGVFHSPYSSFQELS